ncbi:MAG: hypothetical protein IJQ45_10055 [Clostridia bacterium]|nr:hypothetical protein [Clostridia bacterium]
MRSDCIHIDNKGNGFEAALFQAEAVAKYRELNDKEALQLRILTEELMGMVRSITGEMAGTFWIDSEGKAFTLHLSTKTRMDASKRYQLISASTSKTNEEAKSFIGYLRDKFESAMLAEDNICYDSNGMPLDELPEEEEPDRYEYSILRKLADEIKIHVRGGTVELDVLKTF